MIGLRMSYYQNDGILLTDVLKELVLLFQAECVQVMVPVLILNHMQFQSSGMPHYFLSQFLGSHMLIFSCGSSLNYKMSFMSASCPMTLRRQYGCFADKLLSRVVSNLFFC